MDNSTIWATLSAMFAGIGFIFDLNIAIPFFFGSALCAVLCYTDYKDEQKPKPKTWLDRLCDPLEHPKYPQIYGKLVKYADPANNTSQIIGKCAEGEIACQNGIKPSSNICLSTRELKMLNVPDDIIQSIGLDIEINGEVFISTFDGINGIIVGLNDTHYTYPEMVEFLRTTFEDAV